MLQALGAAGRRTVTRALVALAFGHLAVATISGRLPVAPLPGLAIAMAAAAIVILLLASIADDDRRIAVAIRRAEPVVRDDGRRHPYPADRLCAQVDRLADALVTVEQRLLHRHPVSGLPTRELLLRAIEADGAGLVGIVHLTDLERLHAFDEQSADALLATLAERMTAMLGQERLITQVDRARVAIWYGPEVPAASARAQLDALGYALGGSVMIGEREILPEVRVSAAAATKGTKPSSILARAIAGGAARTTPADARELDPLIVARERFAIEQDLRRAVDRSELELHYQPLIDAQSQRVCGAEALLRWRHPTRGLVPPTRFVPIMETAGLADEIGLWALNSACREAHALGQEGLSPFRIAVNVSRGQLDHQDLPTLIERILARHALGPDALEIELTETVATADTARAAALFDRLRALGVAIAIDDFGTGYSSFSALRALRFSKIKIDREFVTAVDRRRDSQAICRSILALGQGLGIRVLAEGVETAAEYGWLRAQGCMHFQGYYFAKPLPADALRAFARDTAGLHALLFPSSPLFGPTERLRA